MNPQARFDALVESYADVSGVQPPEGARGFGSATLRINGSIFAMLSHDQLVVKLPRDRVTALIDSGDGASFDGGKGRPMKEWLIVVDEDAWFTLAGEALRFVETSKRRPTSR